MKIDLLVSAILLTALASPPALAQSVPSVMKLQRIEVIGNHRVPTADIDSAMTVHVGQKVTKADLAANENAVVGVYTHANVGASLKQRLTIQPSGAVTAAYIITEQAAPAPQGPAVLRLDRVTVEGNSLITTQAIDSAITLHPGDVVDEARVAANMQAILALYKKKNVGAQIVPSATYPQPNHAVVDYKITEKGHD
nr:POTRA domain-containing protein [uncultured Lichenicoccus sp.]